MNLILIGTLLAIIEGLAMWVFSWVDWPYGLKLILDSCLMAIGAITLIHLFILKPTKRAAQATENAILTTMVEGLVVQDKKGSIINFNSAALSILGLSADQLMGRTSVDPRWKSIHEDGSEFPGDQHPAMVALRTGIPQRHVIMGIEQPNGERRWVKINAVPLANSVVTTFADITEQKSMNERLEQLKTRLETAIRAVKFGVWDWNLKSGQLIWDEYMYDLFEIRKQDFSGAYDAFEKTLLVEDAQRVQDELQSVFKSRSPEFRSEFRVRTRDGQIKHIAAAATCFYDSQGQIERLVGNNWDVTELTNKRRELDEQQTKLMHSSKMASLGEMAGGVAHEINNPLTTIRGRATQLIRGLASGELSPEDTQKFLQQIITTADRIAKIVRGLRSFSRDADKDPMAKTRLRQVVDETVDLCRERFRNHGVDLNIEQVADVEFDARGTQISQVLLNLLNNAFDAVEYLPEKWVRVEGRDLGNTIELAVTDSGSGIAPDLATKIMQPFFTSKPTGKGTGLGLSISQRIVSDHGGQLMLDRTAKNTRFVIHLPSRHKSEAAA